jgi:hypothetical protein
MMGHHGQHGAQFPNGFVAAASMKLRAFQADPSVRFLGATSLYQFGVASGCGKSLE